MQKGNGGLIAIIVILVAVIAFMLGRGDTELPFLSGDEDAAETDAANETEESTAQAEPAPPPTPARRAVRVGLDGPGSTACRSGALVANLPMTGGDNDFLAVREAPSSRATQVDKLGQGHPIIICDQNDAGTWIGIVYTNDNSLFRGRDRCGVMDRVPATRAYDGQCQSGWVYAKYVQVAG